MITLKFDTFKHTLEFLFNGLNRKFENVTTIKTYDGYYEVLQRQQTTGKNAPLFRLPINSTIIEFSHE
jgi:hypothetical protein